MLYPVMPMFLTSIGFSVIWIGLLEGIAEATAGFSKGYFGNLSDNIGKRVPFVRTGYLLSSLSKPLMIAFVHPLWILFCRVSDRLGKGIRTSARDAILSGETTSEHKGKVFGLHRAADTLGAALGPSLALVFLYFQPENYKTLFLLAFFPAIAGVAITFIIKENQNYINNRKTSTGFFEFLSYWKTSNRQYKRLIIGLLSLALVNSSDFFLLLILKYNGCSDSLVIIIYIFYNLVYAITSTPIGWLGDKVGLKRAFIAGLCFFAITYFSIITIETELFYFIIFAIYGLYAAATESISKAWLSNLAKQDEMATAFGFYNGWQSICTLVASSLAGLLWNVIDPKAPFLFTASATVLIIGYMLLFTKEK